MIYGRNKVAVTCPACSRAFVLTERRAIADIAAADNPENARHACPQCGTRSTFDALAGQDREPLDARREGRPA